VEAVGAGAEVEEEAGATGVAGTGAEAMVAAVVVRAEAAVAAKGTAE
jgi:hypothetical protein